MTKKHFPPTPAPLRTLTPVAQAKHEARPACFHAPPPVAPFGTRNLFVQAKLQAQPVVQHKPPPLAPLRGHSGITQPKLQAQPVRLHAPPPLAPFHGQGAAAQPKLQVQMTSKHISSSSAPVRETGRAGNFTSNAAQMKPRAAKVSWMVTHLVTARDGSLFGNNWWDQETIGGELYKGQILSVDDEGIFMSRRGANQERSSRRLEDQNSDVSKKWLKVLSVHQNSDLSIRCDSEDVYIRAETVELERAPNKNIIVKVVPEIINPGSYFSGINMAWRGADSKRRKSIDPVLSTLIKNRKDIEEQMEAGVITSKWTSDQIDEGVEVSGFFQHPRGIEPYDVTLKLWKIVAFYDSDEHSPIAALILEKRKGTDYTSVHVSEEKTYMYIRFLVGHPTAGGGGASVLRKAVEISRGEDVELKKVIVDSAFSAVSWYSGQGFSIDDRGSVYEGIGYSDGKLHLKI